MFLRCSDNPTLIDLLFPPVYVVLGEGRYYWSLLSFPLCEFFEMRLKYGKL